VRRQVGFTPTSSALVGDRKFDITAARTLGILAIGALWGYGSRAELVEAGAERLAESPGHVLESFAVRQVSGPTP